MATWQRQPVSYIFRSSYTFCLERISFVYFHRLISFGDPIDIESPTVTTSRIASTCDVRSVTCVGKYDLHVIMRMDQNQSLFEANLTRFLGTKFKSLLRFQCTEYKRDVSAKLYKNKNDIFIVFSNRVSLLFTWAMVKSSVIQSDQ